MRIFVCNTLYFTCRKHELVLLSPRGKGMVRLSEKLSETPRKPSPRIIPSHGSNRAKSPSINSLAHADCSRFHQGVEIRRSKFFHNAVSSARSKLEHSFGHYIRRSFSASTIRVTENILPRSGTDNFCHFAFPNDEFPGILRRNNAVPAPPQIRDSTLSRAQS